MATKTANKTASAPACPDGTKHMLVRCGKPTKPPYTGEKDPGRCSRVKGFCVPPTPDWTCWQHGKDYTTVKNPRMFKNCQDAVDTFEAEAKAKVYEASTNPFLSHNPPVVSVTKTGATYTAATTFKWKVDASRTVITLPDISWPNMTAADKAAVAKALSALQAHEEGHLVIANKYLGELQSDEVTATGATAAAARQALDKKISQHEADVVAELKTRNSGYDTVTNHGTTQSRLGGQDAVLDCP